ncbi:hypothetical protein EI74_0611 [Mycoplasma testudineum]|uniref:Uncharacterized protein n=1 Tax=Mycoplasma testudineum TaxID=244584 RepID=A0A4R6IDN1_9MOLU|nr:hypothetical protein [Mycoplasma testudineum]OYD26678.1 hypothetical protein CG473_02660 [Mycoplasma testudineum]TDO19806.1 hypothetical protein EI74_0611 [Mycoplasma testudineum]
MQINYSNEISQSDLSGISDNIRNSINAVMGAFSGVIAIVLIVLAIFYFVKLSTVANRPELRARYLNSIKWVAITFVAVLIIWGLSNIAITLMQTKLANQSISSSSSQLTNILMKLMK